MSRPTPFELIFTELAAEHFPAIDGEAASRTQDVTDRGQFASLPTVQRVLGTLESPDVIESAPDAAAEYLSLMYVAYHYWRAGLPLIALDRPALEGRLAGPAQPAPSVEHACYVQLPERIVWAQIGVDQPHEPVDGLFVVAGPARREYTVVAVLGVRAERTGFSQITAIATPDEFAAAPLEARTPWLAPVLDGGERMGFKSVTSPAELLLLASLATAKSPA